jgi:hypothetical protein
MPILLAVSPFNKIASGAEFQIAAALITHVMKHMGFRRAS